MPGDPLKETFCVIILDKDLAGLPSRYMLRMCSEDCGKVRRQSQYGEFELNIPRSELSSHEPRELLHSRGYTHVVSGHEELGAVYRFKKRN